MSRTAEDADVRRLKECDYNPPSANRTVRIVSYNTQYLTGLDGRSDADRIASEIKGADIIALQEIDRFWQRTGYIDQASEIADRFPDHRWVYGPGVDIDSSYRDERGRLINRRSQFGNMVLSRWPIQMARNHQLPKLDLGDGISLQRSALETIIEFPDGPCRIISVHLAHLSKLERLLQIGRLLQILRDAPFDGGAWSGADSKFEWGENVVKTPKTSRSIIMGDFNLLPNSDEYHALFEAIGNSGGSTPEICKLVDAWEAKNQGSPNGATFGHVKDPPARKLDYVLMTDDLVNQLSAVWVDQNAVGSDHKPIWIEIKL